MKNVKYDGLILNSNNVIPIMHCFDNNYVIPASVSMYSMLKHANSLSYYVLYVLHTDITTQNQYKLKDILSVFVNAEVIFIDMSHKFTHCWSDLTNKGHYTKELLYKLIAPSMFPQHNRIIITDVDVVFLADISESYHCFDDNENAIAAGAKHVCPSGTWLEEYYKNNYIPTFGRKALSELKICGGFLVFNLDKMRIANTEDIFLKYLEANIDKLIQPEQDVINFCLKDNEVILLPLNYVVCTYMYDIFDDSSKLSSDHHYKPDEISDALNKPFQLHYATGTKPWNDLYCTKSDIWFAYLAECGMQEEYFKKQKASVADEPIFLNKNNILKNVEGHDNLITLSILCCTYNHEKFIKDTLDSLLSQDVDFEYEIIISDDSSTDDTQNIIKKYKVKYPDKLKCILRDKNVGIGKNYTEALKLVSGKYLAICDGDDLWIDKNKLKIQVDFMEKNHDYMICCSSFIQHYLNKNIDDKQFVVNEYISQTHMLKEYYTFSDLLNCRFIASCTVLMRWRFKDNIPNFISSYSIIDFPLTLLHSAYGKIKVMNDNLFSQYNIHDNGITLTSNVTDTHEQLRMIIMEVNQYLEYKFDKTVKKYLLKINEYSSQVLRAENELCIAINAKEDEILPHKHNKMYITKAIFNKIFFHPFLNVFKTLKCITPLPIKIKIKALVSLARNVRYGVMLFLRGRLVTDDDMATALHSMQERLVSEWGTDLATKCQEIRVEYNALLLRLDSHAGRLDSHAERLDSHAERLDSHAGRLDSHAEVVKGFENRIVCLSQQYKSIFEWMNHHCPELVGNIDLLIFDDVFPALSSGFRYAEFTSYLKEFPASLVLASGASLHLLNEGRLPELIRNYQQRYPDLRNQLMVSNEIFPVRLAKLLYVNFLNNAYALLSIAEEAEAPFVFTLYPGGGFVLNVPECDLKLKRIFASPCFSRVIVTQQITYDYLVSMGLCLPEKIEFIFGVVMPHVAFVDPIPKDKMRWGFGKEQMDICFMAHRYTPNGEDKGYDLFVHVACRLRKLYDNIYFHVVGSYDHSVIDVTLIHDRIKFHGTLSQEQLDDFFKGIDMIVSPNISGKIAIGAFDGFPTTCCTEAGLRGVAIFCTDEFNSAVGRFDDCVDFIKLEYNLDRIVSKVEYYYFNPLELRSIGECGSQKIMSLYSYQSQIAPRLRILKEVIASPFVFDAEKLRGLTSNNCHFNPLVITDFAMLKETV